MINILVVDDQKFIHQVIENYLAQESDLKIIDFADNGKIGIEKIANLKPDIVLMDIEMPVMDGFTATKIITEKFLDTKVLILTTDDNEEYLCKALQLGAKGYWLKSTTAEELANAIRYVHKGYFQLGLELIEKYLHKVLEFQSKTSENPEIDKKSDFLQATSTKLEGNFKNFQGLTPKATSKAIESMVRKEIVLLEERDANVQFKLDRLKHRLNVESQHIKIIFRIQIVCAFLLIVLLIIVGYLIFRQLK
jgi:DNA-binding NarL/FixJ family response regulator